MLSPNDQHQNESADGESKYQYPANQGKIRLGLVDAMLAVSGVFVIIGTTLAMSASQKIKIAAVWIFVLAVIVGSIAVGIRLTHEFSRDKVSPTSASVGQGDRPYLWVKSITPYLDKPEFKEKGMIVELTIENAGKAPAFNATVESRLIIAKKKFNSLGEIPAGTPAQDITPTFLPPGGVTQQVLPDVDGAPVDPVLISMIQKGESFVYVLSTIQYGGVDKKRYTCKFCSYYHAKQKAFFETPFHNECD